MNLNKKTSLGLMSYMAMALASESGLADREFGMGMGSSRGVNYGANPNAPNGTRKDKATKARRAKNKAARKQRKNRK